MDLSHLRRLQELIFATESAADKVLDDCFRDRQPWSRLVYVTEQVRFFVAGAPETSPDEYAVRHPYDGHVVAPVATDAEAVNASAYGLQAGCSRTTCRPPSPHTARWTSAA
jgi:hypothetical protein